MRNREGNEMNITIDNLNLTDKQNKNFEIAVKIMGKSRKQRHNATISSAMAAQKGNVKHEQLSMIL